MRNKKDRSSWVSYWPILLFAVLRKLHFHAFFRLWGCDIHIIGNNHQRFLIAVTFSACDSLPHFFRLLIHSILFQSSGCDSHQIKNISIFTNERTIRFCLLPLWKTAQFVFHIIGEPGSSKLLTGLDSPNGKFTDIQFVFPKGKEQIGKPFMLKDCNIIQRLSI